MVLQNPVVRPQPRQSSPSTWADRRRGVGGGAHHGCDRRGAGDAARAQAAAGGHREHPTEPRDGEPVAGGLGDRAVRLGSARRVRSAGTGPPPDEPTRPVRLQDQSRCGIEQRGSASSPDQRASSDGGNERATDGMGSITVRPAGPLDRHGDGGRRQELRAQADGGERSSPEGTLRAHERARHRRRRAHARAASTRSACVSERPPDARRTTLRG